MVCRESEWLMGMATGGQVTASQRTNIDRHRDELQFRLAEIEDRLDHQRAYLEDARAEFEEETELDDGEEASVATRIRHLKWEVQRLENARASVLEELSAIELQIGSCG